LHSEKNDDKLEVMKKIFIILLFYYFIILLFPSLTWAALPGDPGCTYTGPHNPGDPPAGTSCQNDWETPLGCGGRSACDWCSEWAFGPEQEFIEAVESDEMSLPPWIFEVTKNLMLTSDVAIAGVPVEVAQGPTGPVYARKGGAISIVTNLVSYLYHIQPASSVEYLADVSQNLGLVSPVYAQGLGWTAFSPILNLWKIFRDISYLAFVMIFVVIGFMIMFRAKIDPQTVISVQNALPKIVVTLLLITFSYAIAGFIIDLGRLSTKVVANVLVDKELILVGYTGSEKQDRLQDLLNANVFALVNPLRNIDFLIKHLKEAGIPVVSTLTKIPIIDQLTVGLVFRLAGFFIMFKIFFALIGPYIAVILSVVFAPFQLLIGALPGTTGGFTGWLKQLIANVLVFPVTFVMLAMAAVFKGYSEAAWVGGSAEWGVLERKYQISWFPATIGNWGAAAGDLICFGILFTIPKVVEIVQSVLQIKPSPWTGAAGEEIKAGVARIPFIGGSIAKSM
jgi:hypothetical protein